MSNQGLPRVKIGCCGFPVSRKDYFRQFKLVEVQQTFYKLPRLETASRWRQQAPSDFEFILKACQLITHPSASPTYRKAGINKLEEIVHQKRIAIMCAGRFPWRCYRRFIALELEKRGWQVNHIIDRGRDWVLGKRPANGKQVKLV